MSFPLPNRESVVAKLVDGYKKACSHGPGAYYFTKGPKYTCICIVVPGEMFPRCIPVNTGDGSGWTWDGNEASPTLTPSILARGVKQDGSGEVFEIWHGYMRAGKLESC